MRIEMQHIEKVFGTNQVLFDAGIDIVPAEVHALMGGIGVETALKLFNGESVDSEIPADVTVLDAEILESRN